MKTTALLTNKRFGSLSELAGCRHGLRKCETWTGMLVSNSLRGLLTTVDETYTIQMQQFRTITLTVTHFNIHCTSGSSLSVTDPVVPGEKTRSFCNFDRPPVTVVSRGMSLIVRYIPGQGVDNKEGFMAQYTTKEYGEDLKWMTTRELVSSNTFSI